ncbi:hypothetical protein ESCOCK400B_19280 [Escherichia coli]
MTGLLTDASLCSLSNPGINMKTLSGCANSLCDREVLPAKPEFNGY